MTLDVPLRELDTQRLHQGLSETILVNTLTDVRVFKKKNIASTRAKVLITTMMMSDDDDVMMMMTMIMTMTMTTTIFVIFHLLYWYFNSSK